MTEIRDHFRKLAHLLKAKAYSTSPASALDRAVSDFGLLDAGLQIDIDREKDMSRWGPNASRRASQNAEHARLQRVQRRHIANRCTGMRMSTGQVLR